MSDQIQFDQPYVDVDEWRDLPVRHRYVHGGFHGTDTRFSMYMPPAERYGGRFFQHITPVPDSEHLAAQATGAADRIGFSIASGAYFLETNGGGADAAPGAADSTVGGYRANAAAAEQSRVIAAEMYGPHRAFGYAYGGSGGGFRTISAAQCTTGVWDGFVPYVIGSPVAMPNMFTVRLHAMRLLRDHLDAVDDAVDAGGSGDPYSVIPSELHDVFTEATRMGFPVGSWFGHRTMGMHGFAALFGALPMIDPGYFEDFWTKPGYLGHDRPELVLPDVVQLTTTVGELLPGGATRADVTQLERGTSGRVDTAWQDADAVGRPAAIRLGTPAPRPMIGGELHIRSGAAAGRTIIIDEVHDDVLTFVPFAADGTELIRPGDEVEVDNRRFLASQTYHRHQVPDGEFRTFDQFRLPDGTPRYPQRGLLLGPLIANAAVGSVQNGEFDGKMIVVSCLFDREAMPWQASWYADKVRAHFGDTTDERFRLWLVDHALHGDDEEQEHPTRSVSYLGVLQQALRDLSAWVERDEVPAGSTVHDVVDGQVVVPADVVARQGVQPVVTLTADGAQRAEIAVGADVVLRAEVSVPPGTGSVVAVEWDLDGSGEFAVRPAAEPSARMTVERHHRFDSPGTHFVTVRVAAQRSTDGSLFARAQNIARVRVIVHG